MQQVIFTVSLGSIYLLFAMGLTLVWGTVGILNFAHGATFMFAAFIAHVVSERMTLGLPALLLVGIAVGMAMSVLIQVVAYSQIQRRAKDHAAAELQILIAGIGLATIPLAIAQRETLSNPFGFVGSTFSSEVYHLGDVRITNTQVIIIGITLVVALSISAWIRWSRGGLGLRAVGVDSEVASLMGVNRAAMSLGVMAVAGGLAGLAGVMTTFDLGAITPESGEPLLIKAFAAAIVGGVGSMAGVAIGAFGLALFETVLLTQTSGTWTDAVAFGMIFAVLLLRPQGIFGRAEVRRT